MGTGNVACDFFKSYVSDLTKDHDELTEKPFSCLTLTMGYVYIDVIIAFSKYFYDNQEIKKNPCVDC